MAFSRDEGSRLGKSLRSIFLRSARSYPDFAKDLLNGSLRTKTGVPRCMPISIAFSPIMAQVDPDLLADLAEAELLEELPEDELCGKGRSARNTTNASKRSGQFPRKSGPRARNWRCNPRSSLSEATDTTSTTSASSGTIISTSRLPRFTSPSKVYSRTDQMLL